MKFIPADCSQETGRIMIRPKATASCKIGKWRIERLHLIPIRSANPKNQRFETAGTGRLMACIEQVALSYF